VTLGTEAVFVASSVAVLALPLVSAAAAMTHSALEAIDQTVMLDTKRLLACDTVLKLPARLAVDQATNRSLAMLDQTSTSRLVTKDEATLVTLPNVTFDALDTELAIANGAVSFRLTHNTQGTVLGANVVVGAFQTSDSFLAIVALDESALAILAAQLSTSLTRCKVATTSRSLAMTMATETTLINDIASVAKRLVTILAFAHAHGTARSLAKGLETSSAESFRRTPDIGNDLSRRIHHGLFAAAARRFLRTFQDGFSKLANKVH
jgi:hypothetical protein